MRPYCVQSTHPMSEHCLYWLVESHTASVLAARLKAVQVCFSARTHTLLLLLLFFNALVVIVVRCACPLEHTLGYLWWRCQQWMRERFLASDVDSYQVHHIPYAQRILQVCFCPLDPALSKCCTPFRLYQEELHCSRCFFYHTILLHGGNQAWDVWVSRTFFGHHITWERLQPRRLGIGTQNHPEPITTVFTNFQIVKVTFLTHTHRIIVLLFCSSLTVSNH